MDRRLTCALVSLFALVLSGVSAFAQAIPAVSDIPICPAGELMLEVRMTDKLIMPGVMSLTKMTDKYSDKLTPGDQTKKPVTGTAKPKKAPIDPAKVKAAISDLQQVLSGLKEVHIVLYSVPQNSVASTISSYYTSQMGLATGWTKLFEASDTQTSAMVVERQSKDGIFCLGVFQGKVLAVRTTGTFNSAQVTEWINKYGGDILGAFMGSAFDDESGSPKKPASAKPQSK